MLLFVVGAVVGGILGLVLTALIVAAGKADSVIEEQEVENHGQEG